MTIAAIATFEIRRRARRVSTYVYIGLFFALGCLLTLASAGTFESFKVVTGAGGRIYANSPTSLLECIGSLSHFSMVVTAVICGSAVCEDIELGTTPLFYTTPISKYQYLVGRFLGAFAVAVTVQVAIGVGAWAASISPFPNALFIGPNVPRYFVAPYLTLVLPNLFFTATLFFSLAALTRKMVPVYVGAVVVMMGYFGALAFANDLDQRSTAALFVPFGTTAAMVVTRYWTVVESNTTVLPLTGVLLWNRILWFGVASTLLAVTFARFRFGHAAIGSREKLAVDPKSQTLDVQPGEAPVAALPRVGRRQVPLDYSRGAAFRAFLDLTRLQLRETVRSTVFLVLLLACVAFIAATESNVGQLYGTAVYPVTHLVLGALAAMYPFQLVILGFFAGELVWRERDAKVALLIDATPAPRVVLFAAKFATLLALPVLLLAVELVTGVVLQTAHGYRHYELGVYVAQLFGHELPQLWILCALAVFLHVAINHKYAAHVAVIVYYLSGIALRIANLRQHLYSFDTAPSGPYSDMNGFGPFVVPFAWFTLYWAALAAAFVILSYLLWVRGTGAGLRERLARAWARTTRAVGVGLAVSLAAFLGLLAFLFWNTHILNPYVSPSDQEALRERYERSYKSWESAPSPRIVSVNADVAIYPEALRLVLRGHYDVINKTDRPITKVLLRTPRRARIDSLVFSTDQKLVQEDAPLGLRVYELARPLEVGEKGGIDFALAYEPRGFPDDEMPTDIAKNGTFVNNDLFPRIGYDEGAELEGDTVRKKHHLAPKRWPSLEDPSARNRNLFSSDSDWVDLDTTVSTSPDQFAVAPGRLDKEWVEGNRRYFHYAMDGKVQNFFCYLSARYTRLQDSWKDVAIEIDYHEGHTYDLDRMVRSVKASLDYYTENFGPYQHHLVRIVEFPRYATFAQSFDNTIPYSEGLGFIAKVDETKPDDVDYPFFVTAHEVAHQWWGHQVLGSRMQGAQFLVEGLSEYSALMVMKHKLGAPAMRRFLAHELDSYLFGRSQEDKRELPLMRVESQGYIHYRKASLVMYELQDLLGEGTVNGVLAEFVAKNKFQGPPYPTSADLIAAFRNVTPPEYPHLIEDLFETITLYDNRAVSATATPRPDGRFDLHIAATAKKFRAGEDGAEAEIPVDDPIDIGALDEQGNAVALERVKLAGNAIDRTLVVDRMPAKAGIDPLHKLIDRASSDNVVDVIKEEGPHTPAVQAVR